MVFQVILLKAYRDGYPDWKIREEPEQSVVHWPIVAERQIMGYLVYCWNQENNIINLFLILHVNHHLHLILNEKRSRLGKIASPCPTQWRQDAFNAL